MTTAVLANESGDDPQSATGSGSGSSNTNTNSANDKLKQTAAMARGLAGDASRTIGNLLPMASLQQLTSRKYTLPDKTVASQVLMYRQLLHTKCRPGLKLSRDYQATAAQKAVMHMPWWEHGIEESKKMVISYDLLITRLWLNGSIDPWTMTEISDTKPAATDQPADADLLDMGDPTPPPLETPTGDAAKPAEDATSSSVDTFINDEGLPPIPHPYWVDRLGFQQPDPVTDFRSGGVLSLAMMVYMVESQPAVCRRFFQGDAAVLPFGITCINVTDMIAKFLMLAKATDRMDALLSQKPFWRMFADPNAILAVQELAMTLLADVVVELTKERQIPILAKHHSTTTSMHEEHNDKVTVFDFATILERTERRVRDDLLGAGPKTVVELRSVAGRLRLKYQTQLDRRIQRAQQQQMDEGGDGKPRGPVPPPQIKEVLDKAGGAAGAMGAFAGGLFSKMKQSSGAALANLNHSNRNNSSSMTPPPSAAVSQPVPTIVKLPPPPPSKDAASAMAETEGDWAGIDMTPATDAISNFSIGDDEDDEIL